LTIFIADKFNETPADIDNNKKVVGGVLQLWQDFFGNALDSHWVKGNHPYWTNPVGTNIIEVGGNLHCETYSAAMVGRAVYSPAVFNDLTCVVDWFSFAWGNADHDASIFIFKDSNNYVWLRRFANPYWASLHLIVCNKCVAGVLSEIARINFFPAAPREGKFKIVRNAGVFEFWYDVGAGWVLLATSSAAIGANCQLLLAIAGSGYPANNWTEIDYASCELFDSNYFWDDLPWIYVIASEGVEHAFDAGLGETWKLSGASCVSGPLSSSVLFEFGVSDSGQFLDVDWKDVVFKPIAEIAANAAAGLYDDHRYIHAKAEYVSDGTVQSFLTSLSIQTGAPPPIGIPQQVEIVIKPERKNIELPVREKLVEVWKSSKRIEIPL